jgi:hypothetical protein
LSPLLRSSEYFPWEYGYGCEQVFLKEALRIGKSVIDGATEQGLDVVMDCFAITGELSVAERYDLGKAMAEYCVSKSVSPKVALIGELPVVTGFVAEVASNRGLTTKAFSERQPALQWLRSFGPKAGAS